MSHGLHRVKIFSYARMTLDRNYASDSVGQAKYAVILASSFQ